MNYTSPWTAEMFTYSELDVRPSDCVTLDLPPASSDCVRDIHGKLSSSDSPPQPDSSVSSHSLSVSCINAKNSDSGDWSHGSPWTAEWFSDEGQQVGSDMNLKEQGNDANLKLVDEVCFNLRDTIAVKSGNPKTSDKQFSQILFRYLTPSFWPKR